MLVQSNKVDFSFDSNFQRKSIASINSIRSLVNNANKIEQVSERCIVKPKKQILSGKKDKEKDKEKKNKEKRKRNIIWFNPPFSLGVKTNVGKKFLALVDKHFPKKTPTERNMQQKHHEDLIQLQ